MHPNELVKLNRRFCKGAEELRYILKDDSGNAYFSNEKIPDPNEGSWLRTIKFKDKNEYLFVLDIDGEGLDEGMLRGVQGLYDTIKNYLHVKPILKASGSKGAQIIFKLVFDEHIREEDCLTHMRNLSYTLWRISTPIVKEHILFDSKPGIDLHMFTKKRMLRTLSKHLRSNRYSIMFAREDNIDVVNQRMDTGDGLEFKKFPTLEFSEDLIIYTYFSEKEKIAVSFENLPQFDERRELKKDNRFKSLPKFIKRILLAEHVEHNLKWPTIAYLHVFERMHPNDIVEWLWKNSNWIDLSNVRITNYHVRWTCRWCQKSMLKDSSNMRYSSALKYSMPSFPLPDDFLNEIILEMMENSNWRAISHLLLRTRSRFLVDVKAERYGESQIAQYNSSSRSRP